MFSGCMMSLWISMIMLMSIWLTHEILVTEKERDCGINIFFHPVSDFISCLCQMQCSCSFYVYPVYTLLIVVFFFWNRKKKIFDLFTSKIRITFNKKLTNGRKQNSYLVSYKEEILIWKFYFLCKSWKPTSLIESNPKVAIFTSVYFKVENVSFNAKYFISACRFE